MNTPKLAKKVNDALHRLSGSEAMGDISGRIKTIEGKITNLVRSLEDGIISTEIVNNRLRELTREKEELSNAVKPKIARHRSRSRNFVPA